MKYIALTVSALALALTACVPAGSDQPIISTPQPPETIDTLAADYVKLTLEADTHEAGYVDAYYGPADLQAAAKANPRSVETLLAETRSLIAKTDNVLRMIKNAEQVRRLQYLRGALVAAETRLQMIGGKKFSFMEEAQGLFATQPEIKPLSYYDGILDKLDHLVPGSGPLAERVDAFNDRYIIPRDRLRPVFEAAIAECKRRTQQYIKLPAGESFTLEFVTGKSWSGYNYYQGGYKSLIQVNTDLPVRISRAVDLGCHEGYPGHHVLNLMTEQKLVREKGWKEFEINPLYSPTSVISEGSANYGIELAFPGAGKLQFEREVIYPLAGLDPKTAQAYDDVLRATDALVGARRTIAKMYLDGEITREQAVALTQKYQLVSRARAEQSISFTDQYRSYVINYSWGKDLVKAAIERGNPDAKTRWQRMEAILSEPTLPSDLVAN